MLENTTPFSEYWPVAAIAPLLLLGFFLILRKWALITSPTPTISEPDPPGIMHTISVFKRKIPTAFLLFVIGITPLLLFFLFIAIGINHFQGIFLGLCFIACIFAGMFVSPIFFLCGLVTVFPSPLKFKIWGICLNLLGLGFYVFYVLIIGFST